MKRALRLVDRAQIEWGVQVDEQEPIVVPGGGTRTAEDAAYRLARTLQEAEEAIGSPLRWRAVSRTLTSLWETL